MANAIPDKKEVLFKKSSLIRLPIRLGEDVFTRKRISSRNVERLVLGMESFQRIMRINDVEAHRACATSAFREAANCQEVVADVYDKTGIAIEIIDGLEEARLLFSNELMKQFKTGEEAFLYIDVGGGSTEFTIIADNRESLSRSFELGTIRLMQGTDKKSEWKAMRTWLKEATEGLEDVAMIGSGGNINRIHKMSGKPPGVPLSLDYLEGQYVFLKRFTTEELVKRLDLNTDRADVITHAAKIYISAMQWAGSEKMFVPKIGLSDGIVRDLYWRLHKP